MSADTVECPFCAEPIKAKAKKCRHCGEFLVEGATQETILAEHAEKVEVVVATAVQAIQQLEETQTEEEDNGEGDNAEDDDSEQSGIRKLAGEVASGVTTAVAEMVQEEASEALTEALAT